MSTQGGCKLLQQRPELAALLQVQHSEDGFGAFPGCLAGGLRAALAAAPFVASGGSRADNETASVIRIALAVDSAGFLQLGEQLAQRGRAHVEQFQQLRLGDGPAPPDQIQHMLLGVRAVIVTVVGAGHETGGEAKEHGQFVNITGFRRVSICIHGDPPRRRRRPPAFFPCRKRVRSKGSACHTGGTVLRRSTHGLPLPEPHPRAAFVLPPKKG